MRFINVIKVALRALRRSALRSVLTALGIIIGVAAVIAMVSIGNGAKSRSRPPSPAWARISSPCFQAARLPAACAVAGAPPAR
jgi:hypothetical protein